MNSSTVVNPGRVRLAPPFWANEGSCSRVSLLDGIGHEPALYELVFNHHPSPCHTSLWPIFLATRRPWKDIINKSACLPARNIFQFVKKNVKMTDNKSTAELLEKVILQGISPPTPQPLLSNVKNGSCGFRHRRTSTSTHQRTEDAAVCCSKV